jgi:micrococcal nuclease
MPAARPRSARPVWANGLLFLLGGAAALGASLAWRPPAFSSGAGSGPRLSEPLATPLVQMIDGDTFDVGGVRIRVADIDTPEVHGRCPEESRLAAQATARMEALLGEGPFELGPIPGRDEDVYGRKLRIVSRAGRSLGDVLVAEGLAHPWVGHKLPWCA